MLDAAACERPIIGTNSPVTWERIAYENGLAFEAENANDLRCKLTLLIENPDLREVMGKRGRKLIIEKYSWPKIAERFLDEYQRVINLNQSKVNPTFHRHFHLDHA
jgi:glycosyltransferase involved in cell wall biosynthesis